MELEHASSINENKLNEMGYQSTCWRAPSNIALVKYWGKKENQIPCNPSISYTLSKCNTTTKLFYREGSGDFAFYYQGKLNADFSSKALKLINKAKELYPKLSNYDLVMDTENSFPHSSGIASSASSMASVALCLKDILNLSDEQTSSLARLGSGSACRSLHGQLNVWGNHAEFESSNEYSINVSEKVPGEMLKINDSILIVSSEKKSVSSTLGHQLMNNHPHAERRFENAHQNLSNLYKAMKEKNFQQWGEIIEREAMELHGLMMTSTPWFNLMKPETLKIIELIKEFREKNNLPVYFTLDAGPNIHLLYPSELKDSVHPWILSEIVPHLENGQWFDDVVGNGAERL